MTLTEDEVAVIRGAVHDWMAKYGMFAPPKQLQAARVVLRKLPAPTRIKKQVIRTKGY